MNEHESEPIRGLPGLLPEGEHIVWQAEPCWRQLALRVFHLRKVAVYFGLLAGLHLALKVADGTPPAAAAQGALWLVLLGGAAVLILGLLAWLYARTTVYTMTNRRLVMRFGVALPMIINIPWDKIDAAGVLRRSADQGDLILSLARGEKMSYWLLWPHVKPWRFSPVQPALRCLDAVGDAGWQLQRVISEQQPGRVTPIRPHSSTDAAPADEASRTAAFS
jgi:hypothetical protein